ncbi:MAG TPA: 3-deoxy-manno-octulosonate cytidylyltransferase [Thermoanaerobaculia bacterium]|jgi:3-deoxy-manno-octulosonate cytidylyltransferase (CMP-KDO synthetase)|nr:3-deoxy-manno-octulosonate cytidylyltransferase [Thermoanaerobaculia bacterium]
MTVIAVIPARYASVRFPGKPLAPLAGRPMVVHVLEAVRAAKRVDRVLVATDDARIAACVRSAGGEAVLTSATAASGTDRVAEVARGIPADVYLNVQGDEPLMPPENIDRAVATLSEGRDRSLATLSFPIGAAGAGDSDTVKVAVARDGRALYFSRSPIPYYRQGPPAYRKHLGIYAYRAEALAAVAALPPSPLEKAESLEQLRWLEAGYTIWVGEAAGDSIGVDTPADLVRAEGGLKDVEARLAKETVP